MANNLKKSLKPHNPGPEIYEDVEEAEKQIANPSDFRRYANEILDLLPIKSGKLLDVGCGLGWLVKEAGDRGYQATGVDTSKTLVKLGKKKLGLDLRNNFPTKEKFDVVIAKHVLEHIKDADTFLLQIKRVLKKNGTLVIACPNSKSFMHWIFQDRWYGLCPNQHVWQFTPKSLAELLSRNGFKIKKVIINSLDYRPNGIKRLIFFVATTFANFFHLGDQVIVIC